MLNEKNTQHFQKNQQNRFSFQQNSSMFTHDEFISVNGKAKGPHRLMQRKSILNLMVKGNCDAAAETAVFKVVEIYRSNFGM